MKNNKCDLAELRAHMVGNALAPTEEIVADAKTHFYGIKSNGSVRQAMYTATPYLFGDDPAGPALICHYGLVDDPKQYCYSSSETKK